MGNLARSTARRHVWKLSRAKGIPLARVQVLKGEGKVVPKRECPTLESTLASTGLGRPGQLPFEMHKVLSTVFCSPTVRTES